MRNIKLVLGLLGIGLILSGCTNSQDVNSYIQKETELLQSDTSISTTVVKQEKVTEDKEESTTWVCDNTFSFSTDESVIISDDSIIFSMQDEGGKSMFSFLTTTKQITTVMHDYALTNQMTSEDWVSSTINGIECKELVSKMNTTTVKTRIWTAFNGKVCIFISSIDDNNDIGNRILEDLESSIKDISKQ